MQHRLWNLAHPEAPNRQGSMHPARRTSVLASFLACRQDFFQGDLHGSFSKLADTRESSVDFFLPSVHFRHDPRDGTAMSCNDERFPALDFIEQLGKTSFGVGGLYLAHVIFD